MGVFKDAKRYRKLLTDYGINEGHVGDVIEQYETVVCELTGGLLSKPTYDAQVVIDKVNERFCNHCDKNVGVNPVIWTKNGKKLLKCGVCDRGLRSNDIYCPYCGAKVGAEG